MYILIFEIEKAPPSSQSIVNQRGIIVAGLLLEIFSSRKCLDFILIRKTLIDFSTTYTFLYIDFFLTIFLI